MLPGTEVQRVQYSQRRLGASMRLMQIRDLLEGKGSPDNGTDQWSLVEMRTFPSYKSLKTPIPQFSTARHQWNCGIGAKFSIMPAQLLKLARILSRFIGVVALQVQRNCSIGPRHAHSKVQICPEFYDVLVTSLYICVFYFGCRRSLQQLHVVLSCACGSYYYRYVFASLDWPEALFSTWPSVRSSVCPIPIEGHKRKVDLCQFAAKRFFFKILCRQDIK